jgi:hypothetical protein
VVGWLAADGADVCNDDCCGVRDRCPSSGFSQQSPFHAAIAADENQPSHLHYVLDKIDSFDLSNWILKTVRNDSVTKDKMNPKLMDF